MRIAVCGTHGVGKTTLSHKLATKLSIPSLTEQATKLLQTKYPFFETERDFSIFSNFQREVLASQLYEENRNQEGFVADRTIVDSWAYVHVRTLIERDFGSFLNVYKEEVLKNLDGRYDKIIFIRYDPYFTKVADDSIRNLNPIFMEEIDRQIGYFFWKLKKDLDILELTTTDFDLRVEKSLEFLKGGLQ